MRNFTNVTVHLQPRTLVLISFIGALVLGWALVGSTAWAQTPRPTLTPVPTDALEPTPAPETQPQAPSVYSGPTLRGRVLNLSTGQPESGVTVVFTTGDVSVEALSNESGEYAILNLGAANGVLNAVPSRESGLRPVTTDVAVQSRPGVETVVNLGVSPNGSGAPPLVPMVELSPVSVSAGDMMTISVLVKNTLPQVISDATITNWLPDKVVPVTIHSSTGNPYFSNNLAVVELGVLGAGDGALVEIVAQATGARTATSLLQGKVSFFYREHAAAQARALGHSDGAAPTVLPVTGVGLPLMGLGLVLIVLIAGWLRRRMGHGLPTS